MRALDILMILVIVVEIQDLAWVASTDLLCEDVNSHYCQKLIDNKPTLCREGCMQRLCRRSCGLCASMRCYQCDEITDPSSCNRTQECPPGQVCIVTETYSQNFEKIFQQGCSTPEFCRQLYGATPPPLNGILLGRKKRNSSLNGRCCARDFCNSHITEIATSQSPPPSSDKACKDESHTACILFILYNKSLCNDPCFSSTLCPRICQKCPCSYKTHCPVGYVNLTVNNQQKCYHFGITDDSWNESRYSCLRTGDGEHCEGLVRVESSEENHVLYEYINRHSHELRVTSSTMFWMDAFTNDTNIHDGTHEDDLHWYWSSNGQRLSYFHFQHHAHNHGGSQNPERFIFFGPGRGESKSGYYWNGAHGSEHHRPLCEYYLSGH